MEFKYYKNEKEFINENEELLLEKEWLNNLILGNCYYALENGIDESWLLASIIDNNRTELIMLLRRPWKLLLYSPTNNKDDRLYKFAAEEVYKIDKEIPGVNSENEIANKFADEYCKLAKKEKKLHIPMRILLLEKLSNSDLRDDVVFRKADIKDKEVLKEFTRNFYNEALQEEISEEELEEKFYSNLEKEYFVLEKKEKIVAQTLSSRKLKKGKNISGVFTPKEERGKGYAYNLVYRVSKKFIDDGAEYCVLFTDDTNPISNHVYEKIGYKRVVDTSDIEFK